MRFKIASLVSALLLSSQAVAGPIIPLPNLYPVAHTGTPKGALRTLQDGKLAVNHFHDLNS